MRKHVFLLLLLLSFAGSLAAQDSLCVMTYNLRFGEIATMEQIGGYIASRNPDIVALQECDWNTRRPMAPHQNGVRFVNELAWRTGMFAAYGKAIDYMGGYYGIGVLSRYPLIKTERVLLPNEDNAEQRTMLVATIELPGGDPLTFICTHLEVSSGDIRLKQIHFIDAWVDENVEGPVMLAGDLNAEPDSPEICQGFTRWQPLTSNEPTFPARNPNIKIDYIFCRSDSGIDLKSTRVCTDASFSDHCPVISYITLKNR